MGSKLLDFGLAKWRNPRGHGAGPLADARGSELPTEPASLTAHALAALNHPSIAAIYGIEVS